MADQPQVEERIDPLSLFSPQIQEPVQGLTYLGYLADTVTFCGHTFGMETISPHMKYSLAQAFQPYRDTIKEPDAYAAIHVGIALVSIDGVRDFCPAIGPDPVQFIQGRLQWISSPPQSGFWQPTIDFLFAHYLAMEAKVGAGIVELHSLSERSRGTLPPSPGSSTAPGPFGELTDLDIPQSEPSS